MIGLSDFDMSLKLTWVRKAISDNFEWSEFAEELKIRRLVWTGERYHSKLYQRAKNPFWKSLILAYKKWHSILIEKSELEIDKQHLWGNPHMNIPFNESLYKSNIIFVCDIFSPLRVLLSKQELELKIGKPIMLTTFFSLCKAIPRHWKTSMEGIPVSYDAYIPPSIQWLTRDKKGYSKHSEDLACQKTDKITPRPRKMASGIKSRRIGGLEVPLYNAYEMLFKCQKLILPI